MEKMLEKLLEINRQLEDAGLGEFDFDHLHRVLCECEKAGPEMIRLERERSVLRNNLIIQIKGKLRALEIAREGKSASLWKDRESQLANLPAERLLELNAELGREFNAAFTSRPNFRRTVSTGINQADDKNYKIGG